MMWESRTPRLKKHRSSHLQHSKKETHLDPYQSKSSTSSYWTTEPDPDLHFESRHSARNNNNNHHHHKEKDRRSTNGRIVPQTHLKSSRGLFVMSADAALSGIPTHNLRTSHMVAPQQNHPLSTPNTPESLRKQQKAEFNLRARAQLLARVQTTPSGGGGNGGQRPNSYHEKLHPYLATTANINNSTNTTTTNTTTKRSTTSSVRRDNLNNLNRRSMPPPSNNKFELSELETNLPRIDLEAIEAHLKGAREDERKVLGMFSSVISSLRAHSDQLAEKVSKSRLGDRIRENTPQLQLQLVQQVVQELSLKKRVLEVANWARNSRPGGIVEGPTSRNLDFEGTRSYLERTRALKRDIHRRSLRRPQSPNLIQLLPSTTTTESSSYNSSSEDDDDGSKPSKISPKTEKRNRRSDREEIRRRLALDADDTLPDKIHPRKSLHSRLQSNNLQICFMNETSETSEDSESSPSDNESRNQKQQQQPNSLPHNISGGSTEGPKVLVEDFASLQGRLQAEARAALSQAKELARLQFTEERERDREGEAGIGGGRVSPITLLVRRSLQKVGLSLPPEKRRATRHLLTEMNVAQLQIIVNDLHSHIEGLNEGLVSHLLERDDLNMEQDSMLVDIEDLNRYLQAKQPPSNSKKTTSGPPSLPTPNTRTSILGHRK